MNRFFCPKPEILDNMIFMKDKEQLHHIKRVLRLKVGEGAVIFDQDGNEYDCLIAKIEEDVVLEIKEKRSPDKSNIRVKLTIACAIPKKSKIDDIIDKLTQLGVERVIPLKTERVVVKLDKRKERLRFERWQKIALSAAQQSQRANIADIGPVMTMRELLAASAEFDLKLIPTLGGERRPLKEIFSEGHFRNILVLIGPEGDFSDEEVKSAKNAGFIPVTLGELVLRVDTAAVAVASFIRFYASN
jgi:16S rRNA (uracil1498-N3)-methyltransferase